MEDQEALQPQQQILVKCTNCDENNYSEWYCTNCNELLCEDCRVAHSRVKLTKDHIIISNITQINNNNSLPNKSSNFLNKKSISNYLNCHIHTREKLNIFCETCDILTCRDCQLSQMHKDHKHKHLTEAANIQRNKFNLYLKQLKQRKLLIDGRYYFFTLTLYWRYLWFK
jgi:tripartite motif-containing protein 33